MSSMYIEVIGLLDGFLTMIGFVPQLIKIWRYGSTEGVSLGMYFVLLSGVSLCLIYGFFINSLSIIISNSIAVIIQICIISIFIINRKKGM